LRKKTFEACTLPIIRQISARLLWNDGVRKINNAALRLTSKLWSYTSSFSIHKIFVLKVDNDYIQ